jgi:lipopolysaccharide transport protein LptA
MQTNRTSFRGGGCRDGIFQRSFGGHGSRAVRAHRRWRTGAVKATQGNFSITTDTLRIHYEGDLINPPKDTSAKSQVTKMVAIGRVHIVSDQYIADSDRAEYDPATDILTLIGENSRVTSGLNSVTGSKIILNRRDGKSFAESSGTSRVKAVLHQAPKEGEGPNADKPAEKKQ